MKDILSYESDIWSCADLLISSGIKQSKFPDYMMPFFALIMLEGRMRNEMADIEASEGLTRENNLQEFIEAFRDRECGYNDYIVREGKTLSTICNNDKTFEQDFRSYLAGFDGTLKELLGIERGTDDSKYLNLDGMVAELRKKGILMQYITQWSQIDLSHYNNSEITTLEEHIKRKWADISAETAGEQYTPEDIISLIAEIVVAKIESLFRENTEIKYGNTLTSLPFKGKEFDVVVANPPYGIPWKGYEKEIRNDQTGQFSFLPTVSDGQLLFLQHNAWHLHENKGIVVEVNNGSSLFSGDAGSGESNIRKYLFDNDWVEAIIQMPSDEFFNTGIVTYLWILNKNKPAERKDKVILINAADLWQPLKKNKGSKRKEMNPEHRAAIVRALVEFKDCAIAKVYDKWHFYFNKQSVVLTETDSEGRYVSKTLNTDGKPYNIKDITSYCQDGTWIWPQDNDAESLKLRNSVLHHFGINAWSVVICSDAIYWVDKENNEIMRTTYAGKHECLGNGAINVQLGYNKRREEHTISAKIVDCTTKDSEIIPFDPNPEVNEQGIKDFLQRYIYKPYTIGENVVGIEVNFNKEFYVPETVEPVDSILAEISDIDKAIANLEKELGL